MLFTTLVGKAQEGFIKDQLLEKSVEQCAFFIGVSSHHENGAT